MEKDEARLEELTRSKNFGELTAEERSFVLGTLESEEGFNAMKRAEAVMKASKLASSPSPDQKHMALLRAKLREQQEPQSPGLFGFRVPAYATVALMVITAGITWILSPQHEAIASPSTTVIQSVDTVYVSRVDTVFSQKTVLRYVASMQPCVEKRNPINLEGKRQAPVGVTMKDKEELDKLLVSGSEP